MEGASHIADIEKLLNLQLWNFDFLLENRSYSKHAILGNRLAKSTWGKRNKFTIFTLAAPNPRVPESVINDKVNEEKSQHWTAVYFIRACQ